MMHANRKDISGVHPLRVFAWAVAIGLVLYGMGMFGNTSIERLTSPFPVREDAMGPALVRAAKPAEPNRMAAPAPVYLPAQFVAEETRAANADPVASF
jgi:hypothetical protein